MLERIDNLYVRNILSAAFVAVIGFILLNLTFLLYAIIVNAIRAMMPPVMIDGANVGLGLEWYVTVTTVVFDLCLLVGYIAVFRSKLLPIYKATLMTVPTAAILVSIGALLSPVQVLVYMFSGILIAAVLAYLYKTKQPWLYWYAVLSVTLALLVMILTGATI